MEMYTKNKIKPLKKLKKQFEVLLRSYSKVYKRRKPTRLLSEYGEVLVQLRLLKKFDIGIPGGQSKADLLIINRKNHNQKYIEIKTSSYKTEEYGTGWGVALNTKRCQKHKNKDFCYFDYLIFVTLYNSNHLCYIFTKEEIEKYKKYLRNRSKRFKASTHRLLISKIPNKESTISNFELTLYKNWKYLNRWGKIKC